MIDFINLGYEGIVVRHFENYYERKRSTMMMKFKPKMSDIYKIIGYNEEVSIEGAPKNRMGSLICIAPDGGAQFAVGTGMTDDDREQLWAIRESLSGMFVEVGYQHITTTSHVPRFPVYLRLAPFLTEVGNV